MEQRMDDFKDLILIGGGEFCKTVIATLKDTAWRPVGIVENDRRIREVAGVPVIGPETRLCQLKNKYSAALITLDFHAGPRLRRYLFMAIQAFGYETPTIVSPLAHVASNVKMGAGSLIMPHAVLAEGAELGSNCLVDANTSCLGNAQIGSNCIIEGETTINENVRIGDGAHIGKNVIIGPGVTLGKRCYIDSGVVVLKDVPAYKIVRA